MERERMDSQAGITSFWLKIIAIAGMTCNHAAYIFADMLPFPANCALTGVGGLTFPIMAFLLAEGWRHTSNITRYETRLAVFAVVSQIPYSLFLSHQGNVLITLFLGLILLHLHDVFGNKTVWWLAVAAIILVSAACDWGVIGIAMILIAALIDDRKKQAMYSVALPALGFGLPAVIELAAGAVSAVGAVLYAVGNAAAGGLLCVYNGKRGRSMKWLFYIYYPAHIAVLGIIHGILSGGWFAV